MATFLTTAKMNPALTARVERAVHGGRSSPLLGRRLVALARVGLVVVLAAGIFSVVRGRRREQEALGRARADLLAVQAKESATLSDEDRHGRERAELWLQRLAGAYAGDVTTDSLRGDGWRATLGKPMVYIRAPLGGLGSSASIAESAINSRKDALLLCLLEPPSARTEQALLDKARPAYVGGATFEDRTANVRRLQDLFLGLPFFQTTFADRIRTAPDTTAIGHLRSDLDRAPLDRTRQAAKADLFLVAIDEPGDGKGPTELDGERPHAIRLHLVDVRTSTILLATRRSVDPSWISPAKRVTYATGLDSCAFAFDLHETLRTPPIPPPPRKGR